MNTPQRCDVCTGTGLVSRACPACHGSGFLGRSAARHAAAADPLDALRGAQCRGWQRRDSDDAVVWLILLPHMDAKNVPECQARLDALFAAAAKEEPE
jgi:hypothetical protein